MPDCIDPMVFAGQPSVLRAVGVDDYSVDAVGHVAGRILLRSKAMGEIIWFWTITGPDLPFDMRPSHGEADSLSEVLKAVQAKFDDWLAWANGLGHPVEWKG